MPYIIIVTKDDKETKDIIHQLEQITQVRNSVDDDYTVDGITTMIDDLGKVKGWIDLRDVEE